MTIETPEEMVRRLFPPDKWNESAAGVALIAIRARDKQIVAWCKEKAVAAELEAKESYEEALALEAKINNTPTGLYFSNAPWKAQLASCHKLVFGFQSQVAVWETVMEFLKGW